MLFKPKKMYKYKILEKCKIDIEECRNPNSPKHEYCEEVARNEQYIFYCYMKPIARFYGYILRQEIRQPKNVVFFGNGKFYNIIFENHLFQVNQRGEYDEMYLTARNITTGELITFNWIGQRTVFEVTPSGYGRDYNQDVVNDVSIVNGQLILKGSRRKSFNSVLNNPLPDKYDVTGDFTLVVESMGTGFTGKFFIDETVSEKKETINHLTEKKQQNTPVANFHTSNSTASAVQKDTSVVKGKVVSTQRHEAQKKKYWLDQNGIVKCPGDACPIECDTECPIYAQTIALQKLTKSDFDGAAKLLRIATSIEPTFGDAWNNLAACYGQMGDHKNAFAAFQRAYEINPKPNPLYGMVVATKNMKDYELAKMFSKTYVTKFGSDDRITALTAEISENELSNKISSEVPKKPFVAEQASPKTVVDQPKEKTKPVQAEQPKVIESVPTKAEVSVEEMRRFGKYYLLLLDQDTREAGYAAMEKMENDFSEASICLGQYYNGTNQGKAKQHLKIAADAGIAEGQWSYSQLLPHSYILDFSDPSDKEYLKYCLAAAEGGCPDAANEMGNICHRKGFYAESTYWYGMAYVLEHQSGIVSLRGITKEWQQKGFSKEYVAHIDGFTEDMHVTALILYKLFMQQIEVQDLHQLMSLALKGEDLAGLVQAKLMEQHQKDESACMAYSVVAKNNNPYALRCYADMLISGKGTEKNVNMALGMYEQAAKKGNTTAMFVMGQKAVKAGDKNLAACWFGMAYDRGMDMAGDWLSKLAE